MGLGLADLYQKNIPVSSRVQLYTRGEAGSGYPWGTNSLLLARVSNAIILSCRSCALWIPRWVSTLRPLSVSPCLHLAERGLAGPSLFLGRFCHLCTYVWRDAGNEEVRDSSGEEVDWRLFIFLVLCVLYIIITIFSFLFDMWASIFRYICICVYARMRVRMHVLVQAYGSPRVMLGVFLCCSLPCSLRSSNWTQSSLISMLAPGSPCFYLLIVGIIGWAAMPTRFWKPKLYLSHLLCKFLIHGTISPGPYILT